MANKKQPEYSAEQGKRFMEQLSQLPPVEVDTSAYGEKTYAVGNMTVREVITFQGLMTVFSPKQRDYVITCEREALAVRGGLGEAVELARILDAAFKLGAQSKSINEAGGK